MILRLNNLILVSQLLGSGRDPNFGLNVLLESLSMIQHCVAGSFPLFKDSLL